MSSEATIENITLKVGGQVISLTHKQFLELKALLDELFDTTPYRFPTVTSVNTAPYLTSGSSGAFSETT